MPQHAKRVRITRKALRQPDEFQTLTGEAVGWAQEHRSQLITAAVVVAVAALGLLAVGRYRAARASAAAVAFQAAHAVFGAGKYAEAATAFATLHDTHGGTPFGSLAVLYRGHALARSGDAAGAAAAYADYVAAGPATDYLRQEALNGLGHAKEAGGDAAAALAAYTDAGAIQGPYRPDSLLAAARLHEAAGRPAEARGVYEKLAAEAPDPEVQALLRTKLPPATANAE